MILTINRIKALDLFLDRIIKALALFLDRIIDALARFVGWLQDKQDTAIINLGYKAVEGAAAAVQKVENEILDLEDARVEAGSDYIEAVNALKAKYRALEQALTDAHAAKVEAINGKLADASLRVLTLEDRYEEVVAGVRDELGVEVNG